MRLKTPIPSGFPLWITTAETSFWRVESEAQMKTAPGALCANSEPDSQGLANATEER